MQLTPDKWEKVKVLFEAAVEHSPETRSAFLSKGCPEDDIRGEVERLLCLDEQRGHFLSGPAIEHGLSAPKETLTGICAPGDILARRFRVIQFLARGGMGEVYEAEDLELREYVAIKLIRPEVLRIHADASKRFKREVHLARQVTHPNVCRIFDMFRHEPTRRPGRRKTGNLILVSMELLRGETLLQRMKWTGRMSPDKVLPIIVQMASALDAAHQMDILHRDFKPGNVFLVPACRPGETRVVVTDFGLALGLVPDANISLTSISARPFMGTPAYMSPEQIEGLKLTPASDIYSLGLVIYQMVTGQRAFEDDVPAIMGVRRLREAPVPPHVWAPELNEVWESAILGCLERDPNRRFRSAGDLVKVLKRKSGTAGQAKHQSYESLAVLPFVNSGGAPDTEYLSDGITENIINALSQMPELRVIARSTVFGYKGRDSDARRVGCDLHVGSVLTGRVVQDKKSLNVSTELLDVNNGWQLWGEQYSRTVDDIFAVQADIANEISLKLRLKLNPAERKKLNKPYTRSAEAYQLFLKGRYYWNKKTESGIRKSIEYFNQAIACDPMFAQAYSGMADAYATLGFVVMLSAPPNEVMPKARAAALRALEIDDTLAEAHASLGMVTMRFSFDFPGALSSFRRARQLNPAYGPAHQWYGECCAAMGDVEEAIDSLKRALEFDPLSLTINAVLGAVLFFARQYDLAIEQCKKTLEMDEHFWPALKFLGISYLQKGNLPEALDALKHGVTASGKNSIMLATLGHAYALAGRREKAKKLLADLKKLEPQRHVPSLCSAFIQVGLGTKDAAFAELEKAYEERSGWLVFLRVDPRFDRLRDDPRFDALLQKIGLTSSRSAA